MIETVTGAIRGEDLGPTLVHEHVRVSRDGVPAEFPHLFDRQAEIERAVVAVTAAADQGIRTICDATVLPLGRDVQLMRAVSVATGVRIVAATGIYTLDALPTFFRCWSPADLAEVFVHDLLVGAQGTTIRAHFLKCATGPEGLTEDVESALRATALAHLRTGAPILTHSTPAQRNGLRQQDVLAAAGVDLRRVVIGHCGDTEDVDHLADIAGRGSFVGLDRFGTGEPISDEARIATVLRLCDRGLIDRLVLSHDYACTTDRYPAEEARRLRPNWRLTYLFDVVIPALERGGLSREDVEMITVVNPRRWLAADG